MESNSRKQGRHSPRELALDSDITKKSYVLPKLEVFPTDPSLAEKIAKALTDVSDLGLRDIVIQLRFNCTANRCEG